MGEPSMGSAEKFRGDSTEVCTSSSPWFSSEDIPAEAWDGTVVQIEDVLVRKGVKFNKGKSRPRELCLKFKDVDKELVVNVTNRRILDSMFSPATERWVGKWVTLYVQKGIQTGDGSTKNGVRFRDDGPRGARPPVQAAPPAAAPKPAAAPPVAPAAAPVTPAADAASAPRDDGPFGPFVRADAIKRVLDAKNRDHLKAALAELKITAATPRDVAALDDATLERLDEHVFDLAIPL